MPRWNDDDKEDVAPEPKLLDKPEPVPPVANPSLLTEAAIVPLEPAPEPIAQEAAHDAAPPKRDEPPSRTDGEIEAPAITRSSEQTEPEEIPNAIKIGILGGKGVGKSYLFQAMVYRTVNIGKAGVLSYYLGDYAPDLWTSELDDPRWLRRSLDDFINAYRIWDRLPSTTQATQIWYRLRLNFRTGILGGNLSTMDIEFLDGSGEALETGLLNVNLKPLWIQAFREATVMVFCLPIWMMFPDSDKMTQKDWDDRERGLKGFGRMLTTYKEIRNPKLRVRTVFVLTQADDPRCALRSLHRRWIKPFIDRATGQDDRHDILRAIKRSSGITRYLASAREVSDYLYREFAHVRIQGLVRNPKELNFGAGPPWLVPVTAVDGVELNRITAQKEKTPGHRYQGDPPVPAHVELPLLAAMCEHHNALM